MINLKQLIDEFNAYEEEKDSYINRAHKRLRNFEGLINKDEFNKLKKKEEDLILKKYNIFTKTGIRVGYYTFDGLEYGLFNIIKSSHGIEAGYAEFKSGEVARFSPYIKKENKISILDETSCTHALTIPIEVTEVDYEPYGVFKANQMHKNGRWVDELAINKEVEDVILVEVSRRRVDYKMTFEEVLRTNMQGWYFFQHFGNKYGENIDEGIINLVIHSASMEDPEIGFMYAETLKYKIIEAEKQRFVNPQLKKWNDERIKKLYKDLGELLSKLEIDTENEYFKKALIDFGERLLKKGEIGYAIKVCEKAGKQGLITIGDNLLGTKDIEHAMLIYEKAGYIEGLKICARRALKAGKEDLMIRALEKVHYKDGLKRFMGSMLKGKKALIEIGDWLFKEGRKDYAIFLYSKAKYIEGLEKCGVEVSILEDVKALKYCGRKAIENGKFDDALRIFEKLGEQGLLQGGRISLEAGHISLAIKMFTVARDIDGLKECSKKAEENGKIDLAIKACVNSENLIGLKTYGKKALELGKTDLVINAYKANNYVDGLKSCVIELIVEERVEEAIKLCEEIKYKEGLKQCSKKLLEKGNISKAIEISYNIKDMGRLKECCEEALHVGRIDLASEAGEKAGIDITMNKEGLEECGREALNKLWVKEAIESFSKARCEKGLKECLEKAKEKGRINEARRAFDEAGENIPENLRFG